MLGGLAVVVFFIVRQRTSDRFRERSLLFPLASGIYGVVLLNDTTKHHTLSVASAVLLLLSAVASIGFGVLRGRTIELFERGGELWEEATRKVLQHQGIDTGVGAAIQTSFTDALLSIRGEGYGRRTRSKG